MSTLTLVISCLTTSHLPWFMDLTLQVPMHCCSYSIRFTSITSHIHNWVLFLLCSISSVFLELFLQWSPVAYWAPTDLGSSSFSVLPFCLFILFMGFSREEYWSGLPFLSPVDHILSELSTMTRPSWVSLQGMAHSFTELDKAVVSLISFLLLWFSLSALWRLVEASWWERLTEGVRIYWLSKSLIQFSVEGRGCVPSLLFDLRPNYDGSNEDNGDLLPKVLWDW